MARINCPHCRTSHELEDTPVRTPDYILWCSGCSIASPLRDWMFYYYDDPSTNKAKATEPKSEPGPKPDTRTVEEKQRDERDDNLRGVFRP